jgi:hypothetical protein
VFFDANYSSPLFRRALSSNYWLSSATTSTTRSSGFPDLHTASPQRCARKALFSGQAGLVLRSWLTTIVSRIDFSERFPIIRQVVNSKDRRHRTDRDACAAVDALYRINVQLSTG